MTPLPLSLTLLIAARGFTQTLFFWSGASVVMFFAARYLFREQLQQWRVQRHLAQIAPFFPEFALSNLRTWADLCAPHVWAGWRRRSSDTLGDFATEALHRQLPEFYGAERFEGRLERVLNVHALGLYPTQADQAPEGIELVLRVEQRGVYTIHDAQGRRLEGGEGSRQIQHFWTLRHDGYKWRLHHLERALRERGDLKARPLPPPLMRWRRPERS
ncbi:hypothetical protein KKF91_16330 [Myxococcota bacterium]|nr:hypothetical protein [Myxococcota bacterium]MBU1432103.1 hypothetical protein [Myxococcota bacterium]MBU1900682.1 hypothetical protein [Myxococcota bacterium]